MLRWLFQLSLFDISVVFFALNAAIFFGALIAGKIIDRFFANERTINRVPVSRTEWWLSFSTVFINTAITSGGWLLWKGGYLHLNVTGSLREILRDALILVLSMDLALYILHRIAHIPFLYRLAHYKHHEYRSVRVVTLFVMNPLEALGFGSLWVLTLMAFPFTIEAIAVFLNLNLYFGITAHCGVPFYPEQLAKIVRRAGLSDPEFHREHHADEKVNMGFYTRIWDLVFKTHSASKA